MAIKHDILACGSGRIAYAETTGEGPAIVMLHGNSLSGACFHHQLQSPLGQEYRMIAPDLPGCGRSEAAADPAKTYSPDGYTEMLASFCDGLGIRDAVFVGWSLGGHLLLEASERLPMRGLMIFGTPPISGIQDVGAAFLPHPVMGALWNKTHSEAEIAQLVDAFVATDNESAKSIIRDDLGRADGRAREVMLGHMMAGTMKDERRIAQELRVPLCVAHGEHDAIINLDFISSLDMPRLWRGKVQIIADAGHAPHMEQPEAFNSVLKSFLLNL